MAGFRKGNPPIDGIYWVLIQWNEGCNVRDENDISILALHYINGTWYDFSDGGQVIDGGGDYEILGYSVPWG